MFRNRSLYSYREERIDISTSHDRWPHYQMKDQLLWPSREEANRNILSLSGKLLHPVAHLFIVHWKELHDQYPNSILTNTYI